MILVLACAVAFVLAAGCGSEKTTQAPVLQDDAPPLPPSGLRVAFDSDGTAKLSWTPNTEPDLAGYRVYRYDPAPDRENSYQLQNVDALLSDATCAFTLRISETVWVRVSAVDQGGNESRASEPIELVWQNPTEGDDGGTTKPSLPGVKDPNANPPRGGTTSPPPTGGGGSPTGGDHGGGVTNPGDDPNIH
jgi:hypothetical protein